jgi:serine/threonine-protein kinase
MPVVGPAEQGSAPGPAALEPAPARVAQVMPPGASTLEASGPKSGRKGLWAGASAVAVVLIGGVAALVAPSKPPAPEVPASAPAASASASQAPKAEVPAPPAPQPVVAVAPDAGSPDAGAVAAATPPPESPAQTGSTGQAPAEQAPVVEAKGTLTVKARPYADVYVDGKLVRREVQGTANFPLGAGPHKVTFKHPLRTESSDFTLAPNGRVMKAFDATRK